ncbi:unnamed protein product, partial [Polarella glacialis]
AIARASGSLQGRSGTLGDGEEGEDDGSPKGELKSENSGVDELQALPAKEGLKFSEQFGLGQLMKIKLNAADWAKRVTKRIREKESLVGVVVRKPSDRAQAERLDESRNKAPQLNEVAKLFQKTVLFSRFPEQALIEMSLRVEERAYRAGEIVFKEGEKQQWLGMVITGSLSCAVEPDKAFMAKLADSSDADDTALVKTGKLPDIEAGMIFGELAALSVREVRSSTVTAQVDSKVMILGHSPMILSLGGFQEDLDGLEAVCKQWRAFLSSQFVSNCHPELQYQIRARATTRKLLPGQELQLGSAAGSEGEGLKQTAIVLAGQAALIRDSSSNKSQVALGPGGVVCDASVLGVKGSATVGCQILETDDEDDKQQANAGIDLLLINRLAFWKSVGCFPKERQAFTRLALERLPPATSDVSSSQILTHLGVSGSFWRSLQGFVRQRVCPPGTDIVAFKDPSDTLSFIQQGKADVIFNGIK